MLIILNLGLSYSSILFLKDSSIHGAGGCDAEDEYAKGYDDGIAVALDILLKETGYCLDDVLELEE